MPTRPAFSANSTTSTSRALSTKASRVRRRCAASGQTKDNPDHRRSLHASAEAERGVGAGDVLAAASLVWTATGPTGYGELGGGMRKVDYD